MALVPFPRTSPGRPDDDEDTKIQLTDPDALDESGRMSFLEHLDELRRRLILSLLAVIAGCVVAFIFIKQIFAFVIKPLQTMLVAAAPAAAAADRTFIATEPTEIFMLYLKVGALTGLCLAIPFVLWQLWLFIAPGLYVHEKKFAVPFVLFSSIFFFAGAFFSHYIAFPYTWQFFLSFESDLVRFMPKLGPTFALYVKMLLAFGVIFQMPVLVLALSRMGLVSAGFLIRNTKYAVLIIFILGAVLSPGGDIPSQVMMAGPMLVLYAISIGIAWLFGRKKRSGEDPAES
jgi:sec-independent protein translocase protein TatC